ncbi:hypothetical protein [Virgibacillus sp. YIM 98842]|nr:hypothetical protein [Virgibacillus sp. YIM 98842]
MFHDAVLTAALTDRLTP